MSVKILKIVVAVALSLFAVCAWAQTDPGSAPTDSKIVEIITLAIKKTSTGIVPIAVQYLSSFMLLQFLITNLTLVARGGELEAVWGKLMGSMLWFSFCWYALDAGPEFIQTVGTGFYSRFAPDLPSPTAILLSVSATGTALLVLGAALGAVSSIVGQFLLYLMFGIVGVGIFFATKLILLQLELGLIVMLAPFNFAFLGLNATKDQGIAPFKSLMSLMFRIVIYGVLYAAFSEINNAMANIAGRYASLSDPLTMIANGWSIFETIIAALIAYLILFGLLYKSDSIAAALTSGTTNLGTADVASAAAAGAAAGALVGSAASSAPATKGIQGMSDFMKKLSGGESVGVKNATTDIGSGGLNAALLKPDTPNMSKSDSSPVGGATDAGSGGSKSKDATTSSAGEAGGAPSAVPGYQGTPNPLPDQSARDPERDAAREKRRKERAATGSGETASVAGSAPDSISKKSLGEHLGNLHHHVAQEKASVGVSVNVNAE